eukprot:9499329-Prorocentrum_lima.AAC.1
MSHSSGKYDVGSETTVGQIAPTDIIRPAFRTNKGPGLVPQPSSSAAASSSSSVPSTTVIRQRVPKSKGSEAEKEAIREQ